MSVDSILAFFFIIPSVVTMASPKPASQPLSLSISAAEHSVRIGMEVTVSAKLTNVSDYSVTFFDSNPSCDYAVEVRDEKGTPVPETTYKRQLKCAHSVEGRNILVTLKARESRDEEILVTRTHELTRPGTYFVQVFRKVPKELSKEPIKSNTIGITLTQ